MTLEIEKLLDETGWRLLQELQESARLSYTELGQRVGLSIPSVTERIRKMEEAGIITGYHAEVNLSKLGIPIQTIIHLQGIGGHSCSHAVAKVSEIPEVLECYRETGGDGIMVKVVATSLDHLARVVDQLSLYGIPTTTVLRSRPMKRHVVPHEILERAKDEEEAH
ncbi:Lrp/AsnC family transcriptional regulator [Ktedonosporobacter rubrisoli]|uniref:Lrp/AsnC family transcriptional regulator n=1 Tax=Ktedonosporobacter rubrisoli TaxID=2509675 RepID=A0A4P6JL88_KTERU|nr:Lrp/AsnC family transcriptional regulator [Ktedonosporobacter rubrisoli]QBD75945.1 Lrp/AsnC family transcriptional regulator [Ktedonosporobacter rubrisoli]